MFRDDLGQLSMLRGRRIRPWDSALASMLSFGLDARLAAGTTPEAGRLLAARARTLVAPAKRRQLASSWGRLLTAARKRPLTRGVRMPARWDQLLAAEPEIISLQDALRAPLPVPVRGVAVANLLLVNAAGPVYNRRSPVDLRAAVGDAVVLMDPTTTLLGDE